MRRLLFFLLPLTLVSGPAVAREIVTASEPEALSVTVYRDPERSEEQAMNRSWPRGFAMISETRNVTLPPGESTLRFDGVAEGMVAVSAIVTGLPGGTIEKNRNADLLSPAALVNGMLGNRVRVTRTNPATGAAQSESAIVRTRADGGLVLQTQDGYEAVRCSGLPEKLVFDGVPTGLSAEPVFTIDTRDDTGGTYQVTLTYLAWGFDWEAHYVATLGEQTTNGEVELSLLSWLTVLNDNGQSFPDAELLAIAGTLNIDSDFEDLSDPPVAAPLRLTCYPIGSTAAGSPAYYGPVPPPPPPSPAMMMEAEADTIMVTAARRKEGLQRAPLAVIAGEEALGDLKLYRIPERMDVTAKGLKQVAFLNQEKVRGEFLYVARCDPYTRIRGPEAAYDMDPAQLLLTTKNEKKNGLGMALPMGGLTLFEPGSTGTQLVAELDMRDYAVGQDVELDLGNSHQVFAECARVSETDPNENGRNWTAMRAAFSNANSYAVTIRVVLGRAADWDIRWPRKKLRLKDGDRIVEARVAANSTADFSWKIRETPVVETRE